MADQINRSEMKLVPTSDLVDPFGKINYWDKPDGSGRMILAFIKNDLTLEGAKMGLAIDGSGSMEPMFGKKPLSKLFQAPPNQVRPAAQAFSAYLASKSKDGKVVALYWATGPGGRDIQVIGDLDQAEAEKYPFNSPDSYGTGTQLLPALKYFTDGIQRKDLKDADLGVYVFITDGQLEDFDNVKNYCITLAKDIEAGRRHEVKLVIIGLGDKVETDQLDALDNLDTGTDVDLWDAKLATELEDLSSIFGELADEDEILVPGDGLVRDENNAIVANYRDTGLPAKLEFTLPKNACKAMILEVGGNTIRQVLP